MPMQDKFRYHPINLHLNAVRLGCLLLEQKKVKIIVRGVVFETFESTLGNFPNTLLGNLPKRNLYLDEKKSAYVLDRCVHSFDAVLFYYQSKGTLAKPSVVTREQFYEELIFYEIDRYIDKRHVEDLMFLKDNDKEKYDLDICNFNISKYISFFNYSKLQNVYTYTYLSITIFSIIAYCLETEPDYRNNVVWIYFEIIASIFFLLELVFTAILSRDLQKFGNSLSMICDFFSLSCSASHVVFHFCATNNWFSKMVQFFRVVRIFKLTKFSKAFRLFLYSIFKCSHYIQVFLISAGTYCFVAAALMLQVENQFQNIFESMYYSIITATGIGYGDFVPTTNVGRLFGATVAVTGLFLFCLPQPVLVNQFISVYYLPEVMCKEDSLRKRAVIKMRETLLKEP
ncbi:potassium voltage-gated channel subfamily A member 5-like [Hydra vulgaris]|uniref:potassium voltage-gated channel subfamily A member 5-like n=1 Tax=Hydra vulgaris TaxID=6087 RepID=UPI0032EA1ECA